MDEETRAGFDEMRRGFEEMRQEMQRGFDEMRRGFAAMNQRFEAIDRRFEAIDQRFEAVDRRFEVVDRRFDAIEERFTDKIRENGVLIEDLRTQIQAVAEGGRVNERAIERLRGEMHERFRENEIIVGGAFRQIRHDIDELRDRR
jgi:predicted  nucleic acid-binding Zn-ribbon protein